MAHIEHAPALAHRLHLLQDARVLDGHLPACEGNHAPACLQVRLIECRALHSITIRVRRRVSCLNPTGWGILIAMPEEQRCDILLRGGTVFDGLGNPGFCADVAITDERIVALGELEGWQAGIGLTHRACASRRALSTSTRTLTSR